MNPTTQMIYNKILEIQKDGNWIESSYRHITWIPVAKVEQMIQKKTLEFATLCEGYDGWNKRGIQKHLIEMIKEFNELKDEIKADKITSATPTSNEGMELPLKSIPSQTNDIKQEVQER